MRRYRIHSTLRPVLAAILAVALMAGGVLTSAATGPDGCRRASGTDSPDRLSVIPPNVSAQPVQLSIRTLRAESWRRARHCPIDLLSRHRRPDHAIGHCAARRCAQLRRGQVPGLPNGLYWLEIASDQPLASVVEIYRTTGDRLAAYRGISGPPAPAGGVYRSVFSPFFDTCGLTLWNIAPQATTLGIDFYQSDGSLVRSLSVTIAANATYTVSGAGIQIPPGRYTAVVSANDPVVGLLSVQTGGQPPTVFELQAPFTTPGFTASLPRALKQVDEGGGPRTSQIFLTNVGSAVGDFNMTFYGANGNPLYTRVVAGLPPFGTIALDLATFSGLPSSGTFSVQASGSQRMTLSALTTYTTPPADHFAATYGERSAAPGSVLAQPAATPDGLLVQYLPRLAKTTEAYTVFSIGNSSVSPTTVEIQYRDLAGSLIANETFTLAAGGWRRFDLRQVAGIPIGFTGSAIVFSDQLLDVLADVFYVPCALPSSGQISRVPAGDLFPNTPVLFTASATGTLPFSYSWTVDGQPAGSNSVTLDYTFQAAGQHTVEVTITNVCGQTTASLGVDVLEPPVPDLSTSSKTASQSAVDAGDTLTYTLILRNTGPVAARATLTDPIPLHTVYVPGSAQASDLSPVTLVGDELHWSGQVVSGAPVTIQYAVQVQSAAIGTSIVNTASLSDGLSHVTALQATAVFNPGTDLRSTKGRSSQTYPPWRCALPGIPPTVLLPTRSATTEALSQAAAPPPGCQSALPIRPILAGCWQRMATCVCRGPSTFVSGTLAARLSAPFRMTSSWTPCHLRLTAWTWYGWGELPPGLVLHRTEAYWSG